MSQKKTKVQRPDPAAMDTHVDRQGHARTADADTPADGDTDGVVEHDPDITDDDMADDDTPAPAPRVRGKTRPDDPPFAAPFSAKGVVVQDAAGRTVAVISGTHVSPEVRARQADWVASKLNA